MSQLKLILGTMTFSGQVGEQDAQQMLEMFSSNGQREIDTAHMYNEGGTEKMLGGLLSGGARERFELATKANPWGNAGLAPEEVRRQLEESLARLNTACVDLFYLHAPDLDTPIEKTLRACQDLYREGKFRRFGLSNYAAWQVAEIVACCRANNWVQPLVYQGMYNALTRDIERELIPCLRNYGISFYAYNPLAGGFLTGKHEQYEDLPDSGRFSGNEMYQERYWKKDYFRVLQDFARVCKDEGIAPAHAALRWINHHSDLAAKQGDGIILGASRPEQLEDNLAACGEGPLPGSVVEALDSGWAVTRPNCMKYFRP